MEMADRGEALQGRSHCLEQVERLQALVGAGVDAGFHDGSFADEAEEATANLQIIHRHLKAFSQILRLHKRPKQMPVHKNG